MTPTAFALAAEVPVRRIEIRVGKLGMADFFDVNAAGSDSHLQFTNWTVDNNGAYDYAADTRGYTYAAIVEYDAPGWALRFAEALMPTVANGIDMDWHLANSRAENLELELRSIDRLLHVRALGLRQPRQYGQLRRSDSGVSPRATTRRRTSAAHRGQGRVKTGAGLNLAYAFLHARAAVRAHRLERRGQRVVRVHRGEQQRAGRRRSHRPVRGIARRIVSASRSSRTACRSRIVITSPLGGLGFLLGDGTLRYGREDIVETYYTAHLRGAASRRQAVCKYVDHPGYNRDRGPVLVGNASACTRSLLRF